MGRYMEAHHYSMADSLLPRRVRSIQMTWKTPKIAELQVGMEINMYACAARA